VLDGIVRIYGIDWTQWDGCYYKNTEWQASNIRLNVPGFSICASTYQS